MKKRLLSGIKPTGDVHIGNYFGAIKQFVDLQNDYESFVFIADYHALNQTYNGKEINDKTIEITKAYIACGLNPDRVILFRQSDIKPVTELTWIFNCLTPIGILNRAHAYKDALAKHEPVNIGLFDYPVLMASDILIYKSDVVPIGQDQKQHLEITREIARIFNEKYAKVFKIPQDIIKKDVATVPGIDGRKMSKSYNNVIGLFDSEALTTKKVMSIVTDSRKPEEPKDPETCNVFALHKLFSQKSLSQIANRYKKGQISYKESKEILASNINIFLRLFRKKKLSLDKNPNYIENILNKGQKKASRVAEQTMKEVFKAMKIN